ncbi:MAG: hypothetical protein V4640_04960 [Verrucomicrobiota bacterium]
MNLLSASVGLRFCQILLLAGAFLAASCSRGGHSEVKEERYKLHEIEVGTSGASGHEIATLLLHCSEGDFYLTSGDPRTRDPSEIIHLFHWILPMVADPKSSGHKSCEVEVRFSQYHSGSRKDQSDTTQKKLWFRFKPHSKLSQQFWVKEFNPGIPTNFVGGFRQRVNVPLVFRDHHWIQTKRKDTW